MHTIIKNYLTYLLLLFCLALTFPLVACSGTRWIEKDDFIPNLHGQIVHFNKPVSYLILSEKNHKDFTEEEILIGKALVRQADSEGMGIFNNYPSERVPYGMSFTIKSSYWLRHDLITREFAADYQKLILQDKNGVISFCHRSMLIDSDQMELSE